MSCFVFEEKAEDKGKLREELAQPLRQMQVDAHVAVCLIHFQDSARRIAKVCIESKITLDEEEYVQVRTRGPVIESDEYSRSSRR